MLCLPPDRSPAHDSVARSALRRGLPPLRVHPQFEVQRPLLKHPEAVADLVVPAVGASSSARPAASPRARGAARSGVAFDVAVYGVPASAGGSLCQILDAFSAVSCQRPIRSGLQSSLRALAEQYPLGARDLLRWISDVSELQALSLRDGRVRWTQEKHAVSIGSVTPDAVAQDCRECFLVGHPERAFTESRQWCPQCRRTAYSRGLWIRRLLKLEWICLVDRR